LSPLASADVFASANQNWETYLISRASKERIEQFQMNSFNVLFLHFGTGTTPHLFNLPILLPI
jgi:hypothetical protein